MKKYQYLLFDLDGTLTDSKPGILSCVRYSLEKMGKPVPEEEQLMCFIGPPLIASYQEYCGMDESEAAACVAVYRERYAVTGLFENSVYPGIPETLQSLCAAGYTLAVATSKPEPYMLRILEHFELNGYFSVVSGSGLDGKRNNKIRVIQDALSQLALMEMGTEPKAEEHGGLFYRDNNWTHGTQYYDVLEKIKSVSIMIGDRRHDIEGAKACRISSLGVHYGYAKEGELSMAGADYEVDELKDLLYFFGTYV